MIDDFYFCYLSIKGMGEGCGGLYLELGVFGESGDSDADSGGVGALAEVLGVDPVDFVEVVHGLI